MNDIVSVLGIAGAVVTIVGGIVGMAATIIAGVFRLFTYLTDRQLRDLRQRNVALRHELDGRGSGDGVADLARQLERTEHERDRLREQLETSEAIAASHEQGLRLARQAREHAESGLAEAEARADAAEVEADRANALAAAAESRAEQLAEQLREAEADTTQDRARIRELEGEHNRITRRLRQAVVLEGRIWTRPVLANSPGFLPLNQRRHAILSVLNLKGGVGKTTVVAYLANAFSRMGLRVLLIDLDLQGSLSSMFVPGAELRRLASRAELRLLQHFWEYSSGFRRAPVADATGDRGRITRYTLPVAGVGDLIAATDDMAYAEQSLVLQWLLHRNSAGASPGIRDVRLLLRSALHEPIAQLDYDIVLLDCPPFINLSCVNAIAASDFLIIPVTPSRRATERAPTLLHRARAIGRQLESDVIPMGLLANRTQVSHRLTASREQDLWSAMLANCHAEWNTGGETFPSFQTYIRRFVNIEHADETFDQTAERPEVRSTFRSLAEEVLTRLGREAPADAVPTASAQTHT